MAPLGEGPSSALDNSFGALFVGAFIAVFLQGLLTLQAWIYYERFPDDKLRLKLFVLFIWLLDTAYLSIVCQAMYHYLVTNWGFQPALQKATVELMIHTPIQDISCFACQLFLIRRIWIFSGRNPYIVFVVTAPCIVFISMSFYIPIRTLVMHYVIPQVRLEGREIALAFISGSIGDVLISGILCYYLRVSGRGALKRSRMIMSDILQYVVVTGSLTSICQVGVLIAYFVDPNGLSYMAIHFSLAQLYANSCLATLNSRKKLRDKLERLDVNEMLEFKAKSGQNQHEVNITNDQHVV